MWERLLMESALSSITGVFLILIVIALWQKLYKAVLSMLVVYIVYIASILVAPPVKSNYNQESLVNNQIVTNADSLVRDSAESEIFFPDSIFILPEDSNIVIDRQQLQNRELTEKNSIGSDSIIDYFDDPVSETVAVPENQIKGETAIRVNSVQIGRNIENRELIGPDSVFSNNAPQLYCLSSIYNMNQLSKITHKWYYNNVLRASIKVNIKKSHNWRCWTFISIKPKLTGTWKVVIEGPEGSHMDSVLFRVVEVDSNQVYQNF